MQHNLKGIWRMLASDLEGRIRFLCLRKHHPLISFLSYDSGVGGELAESLSRRGGWERKDWGLLTTTQSLSALARFHNNWEKNSNSHCFESLCILFSFF